MQVSQYFSNKPRSCCGYDTTHKSINVFQHENVQMKMKEFDESLMDTCRILKDITEKQSHCLVALVQSDPLIKWLKESMKKGKYIHL